MDHDVASDEDTASDPGNGEVPVTIMSKRMMTVVRKECRCAELVCDTGDGVHGDAADEKGENDGGYIN